MEVYPQAVPRTVTLGLPFAGSAPRPVPADPTVERAYVNTELHDDPAEFIAKMRRRTRMLVPDSNSWIVGCLNNDDFTKTLRTKLLDD